MQRVFIHDLIPGRPLEKPLYDKRKNLLLAKNKILTNDMLRTLVRSGTMYAYLGEWDGQAIARLEAAKPVSEYRMTAERMAVLLRSEMEQRLRALDTLDPQPHGEPLSAAVDDRFQPKRNPEMVEEAKAKRDEGIGLLGGIIEGEVDVESAGEAADGVVNDVLDAFIADRSLVNLLLPMEAQAPYLYRHSFNRAVLAINVAAGMGYDRHTVCEIGVGALLSDIGMAMVPGEIINANRRLTMGEFLDVRKHSATGLYMIEKMEGVPVSARFMCYQHHERLDGSGYPKRKQRESIHTFAKIAMVADVYDALVSERPWRAAYHPYTAMETLINKAGAGKFDNGAVRSLLRYLSLFPLGCHVRLSTGETAAVVHTHLDHIDRPIVRVDRLADGSRPESPQTIDLAADPDISIKGIVDLEDA